MALLHDAPEYVVGDLISPFKAAVGINYKALEAETSGCNSPAVWPASACPRPTLKILFKRADHLSAYYEATQLAGFEEAEARRLFGAAARRAETPRLIPLPTAEAQAQFLERFHRLPPLKLAKC